MSRNKIRAGISAVMALLMLGFPVSAEEQPQDLLLDALDAPDSVNYKTEQVRRDDFIKTSNVSCIPSAALCLSRKATPGLWKIWFAGGIKSRRAILWCAMSGWKARRSIRSWC